jgi:poly(beta-D-mannuronate) lyase
MAGNRKLCFLLVVLILSSAPALHAASVDVNTIDALNKAIGKAKPGDRIVLADGKYNASDAITIKQQGTEKQPIVIEAKTVGGVEITGEAGFKIDKGAAYIVVKGFVFTHKAGAIEIAASAHHCRVTRNVFALRVEQRSTYLTVDGDDNEIDHNLFRDKKTEGQMLMIQGPGTQMAKRNWVHHNFFRDFGKGAPNNASGLHVGSSHRSMDSGFTVAEHNLFVRNIGENEGAICNKSSDNIYRFNTIVDSTELSLRHGHRIQVYGNFLLNSSGLRFFAHDHQIYSNYFEQCRPAIAIGNGDNTIPPGPLTSHQTPDRVQVVYNTLVNNRANVQLGGRKNGLGADHLVFANNIIQGGNKAVAIAGPLKEPKWEGNIIWKTEGGGGDLPAGGFREVDPGLVKDPHGVYRLRAVSAAIGKGTGSYPFVSVDMDGQPRSSGKLDVGSDQISDQTPINRPLTDADVGPNAPPEQDRSLISAPQVQWPGRSASRAKRLITTIRHAEQRLSNAPNAPACQAWGLLALAVS